MQGLTVTQVELKAAAVQHEAAAGLEAIGRQISDVAAGTEEDRSELRHLERLLNLPASGLHRGEVTPDNYKDGALNLAGKNELTSLPSLGERPLHTLNLFDCRKLLALPTLPETLEVLNLDMCFQLADLPPWPSHLRALKVTCIQPDPKTGGVKDREALPTLPEGLRLLDVSCSSLRELPLPPALDTLRMAGTGPREFPKLPSRLRQLKLTGVKLGMKELPLPPCLLKLEIAESVDLFGDSLETLGPLPPTLQELALKSSSLMSIKGQWPPPLLLQKLRLDTPKLAQFPAIPNGWEGVLDLRRLLKLERPPDLGDIPHHVVLTFHASAAGESYLPDTYAALQIGLNFGENIRGVRERRPVALKVLLPRHLEPNAPRCCCGCFPRYPERTRTIKNTLFTVFRGPLLVCYPCAACIVAALFIGQGCLAPCGGYPCCPIEDDY